MLEDSTQCPLPENEEQRLRAVRSCEILDTLPEIDFDTLTRVASACFQRPCSISDRSDGFRPVMVQIKTWT